MRAGIIKTGGSQQGARVVQRSNNNSNTNGGVAYANANNTASNTNSNNGSRLANMLKTQGIYDGYD